MSKINDFNDYTSKYNTHADYSYLFGATQTASASGTFSLADYASIKNGSYGKLLKAYYAKQDAENSVSGSDSVQKASLMKSSADKIAMKANSISNAAARSSGTYKNNGTYNNTLAEMIPNKVDKEV